jgi:pimeloyl-ACP methyl ester carboxylesterase
MSHNPLSIGLQGHAGLLAAHLYLTQGDPPFSAVVLCHGITSCKENYADLAEFLCSEGFVVLSYDCRGHGESEGGLDGEAWQDVITALDYVRGYEGVDARRVAVVGSSMGAHSGLRAAAESSAIRAVVALNTAPAGVLKQGLLDAHYWHWIQSSGGCVRVVLPDYLLYLETEDVFDLPLRILPRPVFLVHARDDEFVPYSVSERLYAACGEGSRLWLLDQGGHSGPRRDPVVQQAIVEWLRGALG